MVKMDLKFIKTSNRSSFLNTNYFLVVFKLVPPCFSIIYTAKKLPTAIAMTFKVFMSGV